MPYRFQWGSKAARLQPLAQLQQYDSKVFDSSIGYAGAAGCMPYISGG